jgi:hypothetical protein
VRSTPVFAHLGQRVSREIFILDLHGNRRRRETAGGRPGENVFEGILTGVAVLSGDFIRIGPDGLAGSALVEPSGFCESWDTRFVQGASSSSSARAPGPPAPRSTRKTATSC